jgi:hypothetical protein
MGVKNKEGLRSDIIERFVSQMKKLYQKMMLGTTVYIS